MDIKEFLVDKPDVKAMFRDFEEEDLNKIELTYYARDITIVNRNARESYVIMIVSGICGIFKFLESGEEFCYYKISNYDVCGLSEMLVEDIPRVADIRSLTDVVAFKIQKSDLKEWMFKYPEFYNLVIHNIIKRLHDTLSEHVECKKYDAHANIVSYLIYCYDLYAKVHHKDYQGKVKINETREMISDFIGISIRSVNSTMEVLKSENLITVSHGKILVDKEQYERLKEYKTELLL